MISLPTFSTAKPIVADCRPLRSFLLPVLLAFDSAKPTKGACRPLRSINLVVSPVHYVAKPAKALFRPLRCHHPPIFHAFHSAKPTNSPFSSASLLSFARFARYSFAKPISALCGGLRWWGRGSGGRFLTAKPLWTFRERLRYDMIERLRCIYEIVRARKMLPEFFLADCGDEFFEVEWLEVCDVFEFSCAECRDGRGEHR